MVQWKFLKTRPNFYLPIPQDLILEAFFKIINLGNLHLKFLEWWRVSYTLFWMFFFYHYPFFPWPAFFYLSRGQSFLDPRIYRSGARDPGPLNTHAGQYGWPCVLLSACSSRGDMWSSSKLLTDFIVGTLFFFFSLPYLFKVFEILFLSIFCGNT